MELTIPPAERVFSFEECARIVALHADEARKAIETGAPTESIGLLESLGRVLAEDLFADRDFPPFRRSARDGFACQAGDLQSVPAVLRVVAEIAAGEKPAIPGGSLKPGEAAEIMTGAPAPPGADCVVMVEHTERTGHEVRVLRAANSGDNIVATGSEGKAGERVLSRGTRIDYAAIAVAAAIGRPRLQVFPRPRVAVLATGNELVAVESRPEPHQIRNSNSYSLAAQVLAAGGVPGLLSPARDSHEDLRKSISAVLDHDLLLIAGGVSAGKYDLVEEVLRELGAEFLFTGALIQPGKPTVFARISKQKGYLYCFGLPGNPVSTMVTFEIFARPVLAALGGASAGDFRFVKARLAKGIKVKTGLTRFLPARLTGDIHTTAVAAVPWRGSGDIVARSSANCYIVVPPDCTELHTDDLVTVLLA